MEELEALAQIFGDSKRMDSMWHEQPVGATNANSIRGEIERLDAMRRQQSPSFIPQQQLPSQVEPGIQNPLTPEELKLIQGATVESVPQPSQFIHPQPQLVDEGQLEFNFNRTEQQKTNELLAEISKKLTKVLDALNSKENVTKLTVKKGFDSKVSKESF